MISKLALLRENVAQLSDDGIYDLFESYGMDAALDLMFEDLAKAFLPEKAQGIKATIEYNLTVRRVEHTYCLIVVDNSCKVVRVKKSESDLTYGMSLPNFVRLLVGDLDGLAAWQSGSLLLSGDLSYAEVVPTWFKTD